MVLKVYAFVGKRFLYFSFPYTKNMDFGLCYNHLIYFFSYTRAVANGFSQVVFRFVVDSGISFLLFFVFEL